MTDLDNDPLAAVFDEFRSDVSPLVSPVGADRTRATVHRRKRQHMVTLGAVAALVVAVPVVVEAAAGGPHDPPATTTVTSGSGFYVINEVPYKPSTTAPRGGISVAELYDAKLNLPSWAPDPDAKACPTGPTQFTHGYLPNIPITEGNVEIDNVNYADVDRDGKYETIARIKCDGGHGFTHSDTQVVAFKRDGSKGIRTLGQVATPTGAVTDLCSVRADSPTTIQVQVLDFPVLNGCSGPRDLKPRYITSQWRTFAWKGSRFVQSGGPTTFPPNPYASDLAVNITDLTLLRQANGHYRGAMTLTIKNLGSATVSYRADTIVSTGMTVTGSPGCTLEVKVAGGGMDDAYCAGTGLSGGSSRTMTMTVDAPRRTAIDYHPTTELIPPNGFGDPNYQNDRAEFQIQFQD